LKKPLTEVCQKEIRQRCEVATSFRLQEATYDLADPKDDETLCTNCRSWTGLSALQFNCTKKKILCLECAEHANTICICEDPCCYLRVRYSDRHLKSLEQRINDLMQIRKDRYKALIKHVDTINALTLEQLTPIVETNLSYKFGLPLDDIERIVGEAINWENNLTLVALKSVYQAGNDRKSYYCFCRGKDDGSKMICCDKCDTWYHCECIIMKAEDTSNYGHWYCAMCRAPRTARIKFIENMRRIEMLANEAENLHINLPCTNASFITEVNAELKGMVNNGDIHSIRIGVGLGFGVPLDGSVEDDTEDDTEVVKRVEDVGINSRLVEDDDVEPKKRRRAVEELVEKKKMKIN
ncbi:11130_t:CDS:2, partial [Funneliformis caledonium]